MTIIGTKRSVLGLAAVAALAATACDNEGLTEINVNPNNPLTAPAGPVFTTAARLAATRWLGAGYSLRGTELIAQHLAEVQYPESDQYTRLQANSTSGFFDGAYANELKDLTEVVKAGEAENAPRIYAPAMALRAWVFGYLTDTYGDIPYFQALRGDSATAVFSPVYDAQKDIYADLFKTLAKVSADLVGTPANTRTLGTADPIYSGNATRWQRFANSLRARQAMRLSNVDAATARAEFAAALAAPGGLLASNADNARMAWPGGVNANANPWSVNFQSRDDHRISNVMMTLLRTNADPRVTVWAQRAERDTTGAVLQKYCVGNTTPCYVGLQNALLHSQASPFVAYTSRPGLIFYPASTTYGVTGGTGSTTPSYLLTYAEVSFLKAEAAERGWISGSAAQFYADGIRASMEQWGVATAQIDAYLAQARITYTPGTAGLKQIAQQKWLALFTDGGQAWAEWRRTCQPATIKPGPAAVIATVPRRFQYSVTEVLTNKANLDAATARQGADDFATRMYWDKSPTAAPTYEAGCGAR
jgi:hypothetical protein